MSMNDGESRRQPGYWTHESSGVLRPVIRAYLAGRPMTAAQCATMRAYLRQWIMAEWWDLNPHAGHDERRWLAEMRNSVAALTTRETIQDWIEEAAEAGLDPL